MLYYVFNNQQLGPVNEDQIKKLIAEGKIRRGSRVWSAGMPEWQPIERTKLYPMLGDPNPIINNVNTGAPIAYNKYNISFLQAPPDNYAFQPVSDRGKKYPVVITNTKAFRDGIQLNVNSSFINRFITSLKESNLFLDAGMNFIDFGGEKKQYHQISLTAVENLENHATQVIVYCILIGIAGIIFFPLLLLFLLIKYDKEFTQELTVEFTSVDGVKSTFRAKTIGKINHGIFTNAAMAADALGGSITTSNINSIINQLIKNKVV